MNDNIHPTVRALADAERRRDTAAKRLAAAEGEVVEATKARDGAIREESAARPQPTMYALAKRFGLTPNGVRYIVNQKRPKTTEEQQ